MQSIVWFDSLCYWGCASGKPEQDLLSINGTDVI